MVKRKSISVVRLFKYTKAFLKLIRIQNLMIVGATMYILRWFVVNPLLDYSGFESQISNPLYFLFVLATMCIAGAGYVINDYFDRKTDLINKPGKVILGRILSRRAGMFWHIALNTVGISLGVFISYRLGVLKYSVVFILISGLLWFYSTTYKRQVLLGNLMVAVMVAAVPLLILLYEVPLVIENYKFLLNSNSHLLKQLIGWINGYAFFAFLLTFIREIVKDIEDFEGDFAFGRQTIPIAWGAQTAKWIIYGLSGIALITVVAALAFVLNDAISIVYGIVLVVSPLVLFCYLIVKADTKTDYSRASLLLKVIMLAGLCYVLVAYFFVY